jgi:hypothetical protein
MLKDIIMASILIVLVFAYIIKAFNDEDQTPPFV